MVQGNWLLREFDLLEAHTSLALTSPTLPMQKRLEFEQRLEAIRLKLSTQQSQTIGVGRKRT